MNILILSAGTRCKLVTYFKREENGFGRVITTDCSKYAPALYLSDRYYIVPRMTDPGYLSLLEEICAKEEIRVILPLNEDELQLMADNRQRFERMGILVAVSDAKAVALCRDKYAFYKALSDAQIPCIKTYECKKDSLDYLKSMLEFPVFVKPRYGAGSVGNIKAPSFSFLQELVANSEEELIVQPFVGEKQYDADAYVDFVSREAIAIFAKEKLRMRAGEADKSQTVIEEEIFDVMKRALSLLHLQGPVDADLFRYDGKYHILEINPRFGGVYPHAYECGVNFVRFLARNAGGFSNEPQIGAYKNHAVMLKYTDVMLVQPAGEV